MLTLNSIIQRDADVIAAEAGQDLVMVSIATGSYYGVSDVARTVWDAIERPRRISDLVDDLTARYQIDSFSCEEQTLSFLNALLDEGLVRRWKMGRLRKFWSLTKLEKEFLCEASILLLLSNACVKTVAFRHIDRFLRTHWNEGIRGGIDREQEIRLVQHSISRAANVLPWKSLCLSQSIAQFIMLRRRGIPAVLFAGARFSGDSSLDAHAWVGSGPGAKDKSSENSGFATVIRIGTTDVGR